MRVLCIKIDTLSHIHPDLVDAWSKLRVNKVYHVVDEEEDGYELAEFPHPKQIIWNKDCFIKLGDEDPLLDEVDEEISHTQPALSF